MNQRRIEILEGVRRGRTFWEPTRQLAASPIRVTGNGREDVRNEWATRVLR